MSKVNEVYENKYTPTLSIKGNWYNSFGEHFENI